MDIPALELQLAQRFSIPNVEAVESFLKTHSQLSPLLLQAAGELDKRFSDSALELAVFSDPEGDSPNELFLYVKTSLPVEVALAELDKFDEEWFLEADRQSGHLFNVNLRFA